MLNLNFLLFLFCYFSVAGIIFGLTRGLLKVGDNGWETPVPLLVGFLWPLSIFFIIFFAFTKIGFLIFKKFETKSGREKKLRVKTQEIEKELVEAMEEVEQSLKKNK
jgi:hypothetical protein